jgi:hypothetical protein
MGAGAAAVRVENEVPEELHVARQAFLAAHSHWSQPRVMQAALSGFPFQQGCKEPAVLRHYLDGLFHRPERALTPSAVSIAGI